MGNLVVSVNWRSSPGNDQMIRKTFSSYAKTYGIPTNIDPNYIEYQEGYEKYGVGYGGLVLLFGRESYKHKLSQFANDCDEFLNSLKAEHIIRLEDLPM